MQTPSCESAASVAYRVVPVVPRGPSLSRLWHGLGTRSGPRHLLRLAKVASEVSAAALLDTVLPLPTCAASVEWGRARHLRPSVALFLHWSPTGRVSSMVRNQCALWARQGFSIVFITNSAVPVADWDAVGEHAVLLIRRPNRGLDFGAWRDAWPIVKERLGVPRELLLANDSVLGPIRPIEPIVDAWRGAGDGLFGMTESVAPRPHLQSYLLLARGERAVASVGAHLGRFRDSRSKWRIVQTGEVALTPQALADGNVCGCLFDYATIRSMIDPATRMALGPRFSAAAPDRHFPLNPTIHLWRPLVEQMGFPYLKREVLRRMPDPLSRKAAWRDLVSGSDALLIEDHYRIMGESWAPK